MHNDAEGQQVAPQIGHSNETLLKHALSSSESDTSVFSSSFQILGGGSPKFEDILFESHFRCEWDEKKRKKVSEVFYWCVTLLPHEGTRNWS
jgi:hypothetical protein